MPNPWDVLVPEKGDDTRGVTAEAKGEATSSWELAEVHLSGLFGILNGGKRTNDEATKNYGAPLNFQERLNRLHDAGEAYFRAHCCQSLEGDFEDIVMLARMLSVRRNEIVHSIIKGIPYESFGHVEGDGSFTRVFKVRFFIVPPTYSERKWAAGSRPEFIYSSTEISHYATWFGRMGVAAVNLALRLVGSVLKPSGQKSPEL